MSVFPFGAVLEPVLTFDLAPLWTRARLKAGLTQDCLAAWMRIPPHQLADQLAGRGHLSLQRLLLIAQDIDGRTFLRYLAVELMQATGMDPDQVFQVARLELVLLRVIDRLQRRVPIKAQLKDRREKETA